MSVGADRAFNFFDTHPIASPARESNTDWPQYFTLCMYLYLTSERVSVTFKRIRWSRACYTRMTRAPWPICSS